MRFTLETFFIELTFKVTKKLQRSRDLTENLNYRKYEISSISEDIGKARKIPYYILKYE